ncbi:MAG: hypothetical protein M1835_002667 [Candelina submexicana]|nr:MAG: hypothetical protein M1835_002667 [Candelina submexicana]
MLSRAGLCPTVSHSHQLLIHRSAFFHHSSARRDAGNYYETLGLQYNASAAEVKKKFYSLSKAHHPDHNPNDPEASVRFIKISEAYAVLGSPQKRQKYDRDIQHASGQPSSRRGSHSFTSGPAGGRPASGLSKRRTQFRGPPPSFYRNGGYGSQWTKQQAHPGASSSATAASGRNSGQHASSAGTHGGWDNDVPHFDREGHFRTQEQQDERRRRRMAEGEIPMQGGGSILINFIFVGGIVSLAIFIPTLFERKSTRKGQGFVD